VLLRRREPSRGEDETTISKFATVYAGHVRSPGHGTEDRRLVMVEQLQWFAKEVMPEFTSGVPHA
jgi:hypothetical protein